MSADDLRSRYIWRPDIIPLLCVVLFLVLAVMVLAPAAHLEHIMPARH